MWRSMGGPEAGIRILGIVGSLGARSSNLTLLETAASVAPDGIEVLLYTRLGELPYFDPDIDPDDAPPAVRALRQAIAASDAVLDRKSTRLNSSHRTISYAVFCLKKKKKNNHEQHKLQ